MEIAVRDAGADDVEHVRWCLYTAFTWTPERLKYPFELVMAQPEAVLYYRDWGRQGDLGVVATASDEVVGVAFCRRFTADDHGHGYVDAETPELAVAVAETWRGRGIGTRLIDELATAARLAGFARLSLSVDSDNPAVRLYERIGFQEVSRDREGIRMILQL